MVSSRLRFERPWHKWIWFGSIIVLGIVFWHALTTPIPLSKPQYIVKVDNMVISPITGNETVVCVFTSTHQHCLKFVPHNHLQTQQILPIPPMLPLPQPPLQPPPPPSSTIGPQKKI